MTVTKGTVGAPWVRISTTDFSRFSVVHHAQPFCPVSDDACCCCGADVIGSCSEWRAVIVSGGSGVAGVA
jgi:hypothetical protein